MKGYGIDRYGRRVKEVQRPLPSGGWRNKTSGRVFVEQGDGWWQCRNQRVDEHTSICLDAPILGLVMFFATGDTI